MKKTLAILASILLTAALHAAPQSDALSVLNAFLATFAKDNPAWKGDVVALTDPANVPAGRQLGYSAVLGYYSFAPKTWEQLSDAEKKAVYSDSRLKPFIISLRNPNNYPALTNADTPKPAFGVYPVEGFNPSANRSCSYPAPYPVIPANYGTPAYAPVPAYYAPPAYPMTGAYTPVYAAPLPQPVYGYPQAQYSAPSYAPTAVTPSYPAPMPYYSPNQLSPATALVQPITVTQPEKPQVSRLRMTPEEMLLDRPLKIYMQK